MRSIFSRDGICSLLLVSLLIGCAGFYRPSYGPVGEKHRPALDSVWAQEEFREGSLWRIYIRASDPDGDLDKVWVTFDQLGGTHAPETLILPASQRKKTNGYLFTWAYLKGGASEATRMERRPSGWRTGREI